MKFGGSPVATDFSFLFEIPKFADAAVFKIAIEGWLGLTFEQFEAPIDFIHKKGGEYVVLLIIVGHAAAAFYHHFKFKDRNIIKMLPPKS